MKLKSVRMMSKFVFNDQTGVYKKIKHNVAKCVFGVGDEIGKEIAIDENADVFVVDGRSSIPNNDMVDIAFLDRDDKPIKEMSGVPIQRAILYSGADYVKVRLPRQKKDSILRVQDVGIDVDNGVMIMEIDNIETCEGEDELPKQ